MPPTPSTVRPRLVARKPADSQFAKVLIHSPAGHGKTHLLGTAQDDSRTFPMAFLNFEAGDSTLAGLDIDVFDIRDGRDYDDAFNIVKDPRNGYKSCGVDSITETQIGSLIQILDTDTINRADPDQLAQQDWGIVLVRMRRIVRQFVKMLPMHVFMTALSREEVVPRVGTVKAPAVQGQFASELPGIVDVVAYLALEEHETTKEVQRLLLLHDYPRFAVKARTPWGQTVPTEVVDPTIGRLLDALGYK